VTQVTLSATFFIATPPVHDAEQLFSKNKTPAKGAGVGSTGEIYPEASGTVLSVVSLDP
jgi:hypothetical protein